MAEPEFLDEQERLYFAQAKLGEEVRRFLGSETGRFLHGCAKMELESARDELESFVTQPWPFSLLTRRKLLKIQQRAAAARYFMRWCAEAISEGEYAFRQLETYREGS